MKKRRQIGIIPYGSKAGSNKVNKLQAGGAFSAFAKGADWREDPYEMALMRQRLSEESARKSGYRGRGSSGRATKAATVKPLSQKDFKTFDVIEEGLPGTRAMLNERYEEDQKNFTDMVDKHGVRAVNADEGANKIYGDLVNLKVKYSLLGKDEVKKFEKASTDLTPQDKEALAISTNMDKFVWDVDEKTKKDISHGDYIANPEKYKILTVNQFMNWKRDEDDNVRTDLIDKYMVQGTMSEESLTSQYIDPLDDKLQYKILDNKLVGNDGKTGVSINADAFSKYLVNLQDGKESMKGISENTSAAQKNAMSKALDEIAGELLYFNKDDTDRFQNSVMSVILKQRNVQDALINMKPIDGMTIDKSRNAYLAQQMNLYVVKQFVDKHKKLSGGSSGSGSGSGPNAKFAESSITRGIKSNIDSIEKKNYTLGVPSNQGDGKFPQVNYMKSPRASNNISLDDLDVANVHGGTEAQAKNTFLTSNKKLSVEADFSSGVYLETGVPLEKVMPDGIDYNDYKGNIMLDGRSGVDLIMMPEIDGELAIYGMTRDKRLSDIRLGAKEEFIKFRKSKGLSTFAAANELLPGNTDERKEDEYTAYASWAVRGTQVPHFENEYKKAKKPGSGETASAIEGRRVELEEARHAAGVIETVSKDIEKIYSKKVTIQPYLLVRVMMVDNMNAVVEKYDEDIEGPTPFVEGRGGEQESFITDVLKQAPSGHNWDGEFIYTNVLVKAANPSLVAKAGADAEDIDALRELTTGLVNDYNKLSVFTNQTAQNVSRFLIN